MKSFLPAVKMLDRLSFLWDRFCVLDKSLLAGFAGWLCWLRTYVVYVLCASIANNFETFSVLPTEFKLLIRVRKKAKLNFCIEKA